MVARFVAYRLLQLIPVGFGITLVVFFLVRLIPGDPAVLMLGIRATPANVAHVHKELGLDKSLLQQYWIFLEHAVQGNLGYSYYYSQSAFSLVLERLPPTLFLISYSLAITIVVSIPLAVMVAIRAESAADRVTRAMLVPGLAMPGYWLGAILILVFGVDLHAFPAGGYGDSMLSHFQALFLPAVTVAAGLIPLVVRSLRASMIQSLRADYIDMVRGKGLPERVVVRHALRNALIPTVTILGVNIGFLIGGVVVIEQVFGLPGLGGVMLTAIGTRDYPVIQAATLVFAVLVVAVNLATDLVNLAIDPRLRQSGAR